jgi:hypothetical protein
MKRAGYNYFFFFAAAFFLAGAFFFVAFFIGCFSLYIKYRATPERARLCLLYKVL